MRVKRFGLRWTAPKAADVEGYHVYADPGDDPQFVAKVDAGEWPILKTVTRADEATPAPTQVIFTPGELAEGEYDFAVVAFDEAGGFSDPLSAEAWQDIPLDLTPPDAPTGGEIFSEG